MSEEAQQTEQQPSQEAEVTPAAITPGTALAGTETIASLFTSIFATRANTQGSIAYLWSDAFTIMGKYTDGSCVMAHFEARPFSPTTIGL